MANLKIAKNKKWYGNEDGNNVLHFASASGLHLSIMQYIGEGADVNTPNYMGWTPLMQAARNGHAKCVHLLLAHGADVLAENKYGITSFTMASASGDLNTIEILFKELYKLKLTNDNIEYPISPVAIASLFNHVNIVRYFIMHSMNINAMLVHTGLTPLMFAASVRNTEIMKLLCKYNADPNIVNVNNQTALDIYEENKLPLQKCSQVPVFSISTVYITNEDCDNNAKMYKNEKILLTPTQKFKHSSNCSPIFYSFPGDVSPISPVFYSENNRSLVISEKTYIVDGASPMEKFVYPSNAQKNISISNSHLSEMWNTSNSLLNSRCDSQKIFSGFMDFQQLSINTMGSNTNCNVNNSKCNNSLHLDNPEKVQNWFKSMRNQRKDRLSLSDLPYKKHSNKSRRLSWNGHVHEFQVNNDKLLEYRLVMLLQKKCLGHLIPFFSKQEVEYDVFLTLTENDLIEMGIRCKKERMKILDLIFEINECQI